MKKQNRYSPEVRERAIRLVHEQQEEYESQWSTIIDSVKGWLHARDAACLDTSIRNGSENSGRPVKLGS